MTAERRRVALIVLGAVVVLALVAALVDATTGGGGADDAPPQAEAATLAPDNTLVFVDVSTDGDRAAVQRATDLLQRFGGYAAQRDSLLRRLSGGDQRVDVERDVEPWLGDEAALALTEGGTATAGSLILIEVTDEQKARAFLERNPRSPERRQYKGDPIDQYGSVAVAFKEGWMLVGQDGPVQGALDRASGRGATLADNGIYKATTEDLPEGRVATAYVSAGGLTRLLIPQGDLIGAFASFLNRPALRGLAVSAEATDEGARLLVKTALRPGGTERRNFQPELLGDVPKEALAYLGVNGISGALGNLVRQAAGSAAAVLGRLRDELDGEVALVMERSTPAPILSVIAKTEDEGRTSRTLRELQGPLARLLTPEGSDPPRWRDEDLGDGVTARTLALETGSSLSYAVFGERLVVSTHIDGIRHIKDSDESIEDNEAFADVLDGRPQEVGSLGFLDFSQLLELGEQTGLNDSRAYLAARDDLQKIRAVGISSSGDEEETTAEILLSIP